ncbi:hypothetical protein [Paractinoplanes durhamensis]|uniref:Uncharacterized protein n=1 Tax=Paractinoplanes durhamensis TaxID=113563 RepID=A0ABQ3YZY8_9ACTN|nr:hypothetical protein [Actinoplanes durhamensis]GIE03157.1 hypothetical protein Adu01nite_45070 [Actinoplanes durhamensis]
MRTVLVRLVQVALAVVVAFAGYHLYQDTTSAQTHHRAAMAVMAASISDYSVLGPTGLGRLKLGMSPADAGAAKLVTIDPDWTKTGTAKCLAVSSHGNRAHFARDHGLAAITAASTVRTPEGIGVGASVADVSRAYPKLSLPGTTTAEQQEQLVGYLVASAPGNPAANYVFVFHAGGGGPKPAKVQTVALALAAQDDQCTVAH